MPQLVTRAGGFAGGHLVELLREATGSEPLTSIEDTVRATLDWWRERVR